MAALPRPPTTQLPPHPAARVLPPAGLTLSRPHGTYIVGSYVSIRGMNAWIEDIVGSAAHITLTSGEHWTVDMSLIDPAVVTK